MPKQKSKQQRQKKKPAVPKPTQTKPPSKPKQSPTKQQPKPLVIDYSVVSHAPDSAQAIIERMGKIAKVMDLGYDFNSAKYLVYHNNL